MKKVIVVLVVLMTSEDSHLISTICPRCEDAKTHNFTCMDKYKDCDSCCEGYDEDPNHSDRCVKIFIVEQSPDHVRAALGDEVVLVCKFNVEVKCGWNFKLNGDEVSTAAQSEYQYANNSRECNLTIIRVKAKDYGQWRCRNIGTDKTTNSVYSKVIQLLPLEKVIVHPAKLVNVAYGENAILHASFDQPVECIWYKKHRPQYNLTKVIIDERHHFLVDCGVKRENCSFIIENVDSSDDGRYRCETNDGREAITTRIASVTVYHKIPTVLVHPTKRANVVLYQKVELNCEFNSEVDCEWQLNGRAFGIDGQTIGFRSSNGGWTKNCTIIIYDFKPEFVGWWKCVNRHNKTTASHEAYAGLEESRNASQSCDGYIILVIFAALAPVFAAITTAVSIGVLTFYKVISWKTKNSGTESAAPTQDNRRPNQGETDLPNDENIALLERNGQQESGQNDNANLASSTRVGDGSPEQSVIATSAV